MSDIYTVELFDETKVSAAVKRLALCFNLAAETYLRKSEVLLKKGIELFEATTGSKAPALTEKEDISFIRLQFLMLAAKRQGDQNPGWESYAEALTRHAKEFENSAKEIGLLPNKGL